MIIQSYMVMNIASLFRSPAIVYSEFNKDFICALIQYGPVYLHPLLFLMTSSC